MGLNVTEFIIETDMWRYSQGFTYVTMIFIYFPDDVLSPPYLLPQIVKFTILTRNYFFLIYKNAQNGTFF